MWRTQISEYITDVEVLRDGEWVRLDSRMLLPGDVVRLPSDWLLPADFVIIQGKLPDGRPRKVSNGRGVKHKMCSIDL